MPPPLARVGAHARPAGGEAAVPVGGLAQARAPALWRAPRQLLNCAEAPAHRMNMVEGFGVDWHESSTWITYVDHVIIFE